MEHTKVYPSGNMSWRPTSAQYRIDRIIKGPSLGQGVEQKNTIATVKEDMLAVN